MGNSSLAIAAIRYGQQLAAQVNKKGPTKVSGANFTMPETGLEDAASGSVTAHVAAATFYGDQYTSSTQSTGSFADALQSADDALNAANNSANTYAYQPIVEDTTQSSYYDAATGRQMVSLDGHISGYKGMGYYDDRGRAFTSYGAYLREDGFYYPSGAKVSPNGMYVDTGSGWQFAKGGPAFGLPPNANLSSVPGFNFQG